MEADHDIDRHHIPELRVRFRRPAHSLVDSWILLEPGAHPFPVEWHRNNGLLLQKEAESEPNSIREGDAVADHGAAGHRQELATVVENDRQRLRMAVAVGVDEAVDAYVDDVLPNGPLEDRRALKEAGIKFVDGTWPGRAVLGRYTRKLSELVGKQPATMVEEEKPGPALELRGSPA